MAVLVFLLAVRIFPCSGGYCPEVVRIEEEDVAETLRQRLSRAPSFSVVDMPQVDTSKEEIPSLVDSICDRSLKIERTRIDGVTFSRASEKPFRIERRDTTWRNYGCPNTNCTQEYSCVMEGEGRNGHAPGRLECKCNGMFSGSSSGPGINTCDGSLMELGRKVGGLVIGSLEGVFQRRLAKACPTDLINDAWIPIVDGKIEIRSKADVGIKKSYVLLDSVIKR